MRKNQIIIALLVLASLFTFACGKKNKKEIVPSSNLREFTIEVDTNMSKTELEEAVRKELKPGDGKLVSVKVNHDKAMVKYVADKEIIGVGAVFMKNEETKDEIKKYEAVIISNAKDEDTLKYELENFLDINNAKFVSLEKLETRSNFKVVYKADREVIKDGDEWLYEEDVKISKYEIRIKSFLNNSDLEAKLNEDLKLVKGKVLSLSLVEDIKGGDEIKSYDLSYQASKEFFIEDEVIGPVPEGEIIEKEEEKLVEKKEEKPEEESEEKTEVEKEVKKALNLDDYNTFVGTSYERIFTSWLKEKKDGHLVYSPYSYKKMFEGLGNLTEGFKNSPYIGKVAYSSFETPSNITTETITMLNKDMFASDSDKFKVVDFNKNGGLSEAENTSKDLQERILNEVLLDPDYDENLASVIINATRFYGKWEKPFKKERTEKGDFTTIDNKTVEKDIMKAGDLLKIGYEDELVTAGAKALKSENDDSFVYFLSPKKWDDASLKEVVKNIPNIVRDIHNFNEVNSNSKANYYDTVFVAVPKMDIESKLELDKIERQNGGEELFKPFTERNIIKRVGAGNEALQIDKITQVAKMRMDEEEIEAKAVTQTEVVITSLPPQEKTLLEIDCTHPHFVVTVSGGVISFIGFVGK